MLSYDPDEKPELDPDAVEEGIRLQMHPINVTCDEPDAKVGDPSGVSFIAFAPFIPREGEGIQLEDGESCQVKRVIYKLSRRPGSKMVMMVPNVYAVRLFVDPK